MYVLYTVRCTTLWKLQAFDDDGQRYYGRHATERVHGAGAASEPPRETPPIVPG